MDKKKIIIISICSIVAVIIIGVLIWYFGVYKNQNKEENVIIENEISEEEINYEMSSETPYKITEKDGLYYQNGIKISYNVFNKNGYGSMCRYPIISGLKNKDIEDKINQSLRKSVENFLHDTRENGKRTAEGNTLHFYISCEGNFANILSFYCYIQERKADASPVIAEKFLSYNLIDGSQLKLSDVIQPESDIPNIILSQLQNTKITNEDIIKAYKLGKISVGVSPKKVRIIDSMNNYSVELSLWDILNKVIIYDRFNTSEKLYDGSYEAIGPIYNLSEGISISKRDIMKGDNYYIDYTEHIFGWEALNNEPLPEKVREALNKQLEFNENKIRAYANENKSLFFYAIISTSIQASEDGKAPYDVVVNITYVETTKFEFERSYFPYSMDKLKNPENYELDVFYGMSIKMDGPGTIKTETKNIIIKEDGTVLEPDYVHEAVQTNTAVNESRTIVANSI